MSQGKEIKVNLGCGHIQPQGWVNVDGSNRAKLAHYLPWVDNLLVKLGILSRTDFGPHTTIANLFKPLPFQTGSVRAIYCGEVLEHFKPSDMRRLLDECIRVLAPGGVFRLCVPDCHHFFHKYIAEVDRVRALPRDQWDDTQIRKLMGVFFADICVEKRLFSSMGHYHKWGYDEVQMCLELQRAGMTNVARRNYLDSAIQGINEVETREKEFLIIEGTKSA